MNEGATVNEIANRIEAMMDADESANPEALQNTTPAEPVEADNPTATQEEPLPDVEATESIDEEVEESEDEEVQEADAGEVSEDTGEVEEGDSEEEAWMPESLDELAEAMDVELDDLMSIQLRTKVDGVEGEATLADVLKNYQLNKSLTQRSEKLSQDTKAFEESSQARLQELTDRVNEVNALSGVLEQQIEEQVGQIDWQQLRAEDPAEFAAKRQEFIERIGAIQSAKDQALAKQREEYSRLEQQATLAHQERLVQSHTALLEAVPEWRTPEVMEKGMNEIQDFLVKRGVPEAEVKQIWDHKIVLLARDAMLYDQMKQTAKPAKKKIKPKPRYVKPASRKTKQQANGDRMDKARKRLKKSGSVDDAAALILERMS